MPPTYHPGIKAIIERLRNAWPGLSEIQSSVGELLINYKNTNKTIFRKTKFYISAFGQRLESHSKMHIPRSYSLVCMILTLIAHTGMNNRHSVANITKHSYGPSKKRITGAFMKKTVKSLSIFAIGALLIIVNLLKSEWDYSNFESSASSAKSETNRIVSENLEIIKADEDSILWKADVKNNTKDRTIISITWKVEVYDTLRRRLVDELYCSQTHCVVIGEESASGELINIAPGKIEAVVSCIPNYQGDKYAWRSNYYPRISLSNYESK